MKLLSCLLLASSFAWCGEITMVEEIVAKVNGDIITNADLAHSRAELEAGLRQQGVTGVQYQEQLNERSKDLLRDKIDQLLLVQKGKDLDINVDSDVSKYIANVQAQSKIADPEKFQDYVHQQTGMGYEDWKADLKNSMLTQRVVRQEVAEKINIKHEDIQKYYDEHKADFIRQERVALREILISTQGKDAAGIAAAEKKAQDLVARARKGEVFAQMAKDNSDAITAKNYGDLGSFKKGDLNPIIEKLVWNQPKGYVTDPIRVDAGFVIYRVDDHTKAGQAELADVQDQIMQKLAEPRMEPAVRTYLTELRKSGFLEIKPGYVDTGAAPGKDTSWVDPAALKPETVTKAEVANKPRHKRLLWAIPIPGTTANGGTSSSK